MVHRQFDVVEGLHCASCVVRLERALHDAPGVATVQVDLAARRCTVTGEAGAEAIIARLGQHGFQARVHAADAAAIPRPPFTPVAIALTGAAITMGLHWQGLHDGSWAWIQVGIAGVVLVVPGWSVLRSAARSLRQAQTTMDTLVALGAGSAWLLALASTLHLVHGHFPAADAAAMTIALVLFGRWLEDRARRATGDALRTLLERQPPTAQLVEPTIERTIGVGSLRPGQLIRLRPGDIVPVDGLVVEGGSTIDESLMTGESLAVPKQPGARVVAGTANHQGTLVIQVERAGQDSALARLADLLQRAQSAKPAVQRLVDRLAAVFVPGVILLAIATWLGWWWQSGDALEGVLPAATVLVIACPCALGLATPTALTAAIGRLARLGVFLATPRALEAAARIDTVVFDKTGTLTDGAFIVETVAGNADRALSLAAAVEAGSEHPLALAIRCAATERRLVLPTSSGFQAVPGHGASAQIAGLTVLVGHAGWIQEHAITVPEQDTTSTTVHVAEAGQWIGAIHCRDQERPEAIQVIKRLHDGGWRVVLCSGDREPVVAALARRLGIDDYAANVTPDGKLALVQRLRGEGRRVAFVGDGLNDGPALAAADLGLAPATGSDVATTQADGILALGDLRGVARCLELAHACRQTIRQNLWWAAGYNLVAIPIATGLPAALGLFANDLLTPGIAAAAMAGSSLAVVGNSLRLTRAGERPVPSLLRQGFSDTMRDPPPIAWPRILPRRR